MARTTKTPQAKKKTGIAVLERRPVKLAQGNLVAKLQSKLDQEGLTMVEFANRHKIPYPILTGVISGTRSVAHADKVKVIKPIARVLGIPVAMVYVYAGLFDANDLEVEDSLPKRINMAYEVMSKDDACAPFILNREQFNKLNLTAKTSFVMLYQFAANNRLLEMLSAELKPARKTTVAKKKTSRKS